MQKLQVRDWGPVEGLVEEGIRVDCVEGYSVGSRSELGFVSLLPFFFPFLSTAFSTAGRRGAGKGSEEKGGVQFHGIELRLLWQDLFNIWFA